MNPHPIHSLIIRSLREKDLPDLEWDGEYRHFRRLYRRFYEQMQQGRRMILVAEVEQEIIGQAFVQYFIHREDLPPSLLPGYLHAVRVKETFRDQGIGTLLIEQSENVMLSKEMNCSVIAVEKTNPDARRLYERLGYRYFADDDGEWSYQDDQGIYRFVSSPAHLLRKNLQARQS
ncbi:MAG: GNAT family N-acetyltransferase [Anaerolineales bacterium]|nr:GNAT family N-acetyltransferase [Anaerolineales bacterium]